MTREIGFITHDVGFITHDVGFMTRDVGFITHDVGYMTFDFIKRVFYRLKIKILAIVGVPHPRPRRCCVFPSSAGMFKCERQVQ